MGLNIQNAVDQGLTKVANATAANKAIKEQENFRKSQEEANAKQEEFNKQQINKDKELKKDKLVLQELNYGLQYDESVKNLYNHELEVANEIRKEPGKKGFKFINTEDINKYYDEKYYDYDNKYTMAVSARDRAMKEPKYNDKRTRAGKQFSKAEKDMDMYHRAEAELVQQMNLHNRLFRERNFYKEQLEAIHKEMEMEGISYNRDNAKYDLQNRIRRV